MGDLALIGAVDNGDIELLVLESAQAGVAQVSPDDGTLPVAKLSQIQECLADSSNVRVLRRNRSAESHGDRVGEESRDFREILSA